MRWGPFTFVLGLAVAVLIDGRTVYSPVFGGVFWETQDVVIGGIDRIEVIHGPGGSIWGANAVNGVINVITRRGFSAFAQDEMTIVPRVPTRFDTDLRIRAPGIDTIALSGSSEFKSEVLLAYEGGYRIRWKDRFAIDVAAYRNRYNDPRSQELPTHSIWVAPSRLSSTRAVFASTSIGRRPVNRA